MIILYGVIVTVLVCLPSAFLLLMTQTNVLESSMNWLWSGPGWMDALMLLGMFLIAFIVVWLVSVFIRHGMAKNARAHGATPKDIIDNYGEEYL